jgi:hypothetical protein
MSEITPSNIVHAQPVVNRPLCIVFQSPLGEQLSDVVKWRTNSG